MAERVRAENCSQGPETLKVIEAIILPDLGNAGLSQSWRTVQPCFAPPLPLKLLYQFKPHDSAVDLAMLTGRSCQKE